MNKVGIAVISVDRPEFFEKCISTLPKSDCVLEVINGEDNYSKGIDTVFYSKEKKNVAKNKNIAFKHLVEVEKCDHIFLCEDDIYFSDDSVCQKYIEAYEKTGIRHFNYGGHGFYNKNPQTGLLQPKKTIDYGDVKIDMYHNLLGAFSYYHKSCILSVGNMLERFNNAMEHVDHTYRIIERGCYHPPFWWFADIHESYQYIHDVEEDHGGSVIRKDEKWKQNLHNACQLFKDLNGYFPTDVPQSNESELVISLKRIKNG